MKEGSIKNSFIKFHLYFFCINIFFLYFYFMCVLLKCHSTASPGRTMFRGIGRSNCFPTSFRISFALKLSLAKSALLLFFVFLFALIYFKFQFYVRVFSNSLANIASTADFGRSAS